MASPSELNGTYCNSGVHPGLDNLTLWRLLHPDVDKEAADVRQDEPNDVIKIGFEGGNQLSVHLIRDGKTIAAQQTEFAFSADHHCLSRDTSSIFFRPPLFWITGTEHILVGFDSNSPQRLLVTREAGGTLFLIAFPIFGVGPGETFKYFFERVPRTLQPG